MPTVSRPGADRLIALADVVGVFADGQVPTYDADQGKFVPGFAPGAPVATYVFVQMSASTIWTINHNLKKFPSVAIVDSTGREVVGDVEYIDNNTIRLTFASAFGGKAYLN